MGMNTEVGGTVEAEVSQWVGERAKVVRSLRGVWRYKNLSVEAKIGMFEGNAAPNVLYVCEAWALNAQSRKRPKMLKIK